jgi:Ca2+-binding EF-hand superfamily protein
LILIGAAPAIALGSPARSQAPAPPKPVARADFVKKVDSQFDALDTNHDGSLSKAEVEAAEQRILQQLNAVRQQRVQAQFKQLDTNHDGQLSLQEFAAGFGTPKVNETPDQLLQKLDTNHDGKVSAAEFRAPQLVKFNKADLNHDGTVTVDEERRANGQK